MSTKSTDTVTVALKMPHGLILRCYEMVDEQEPQQNGGHKTVKRARQIMSLGEHRLNGYAERYNASQPPLARGSSYALTHNIPRDFFERWMHDNADSDLVRNNLIFAHGKVESANAFAKEHAETKCGLEPIDPTNLPKGLSTFGTEDHAGA